MIQHSPSIVNLMGAMLKAERVREVIDYDRATGRFYWRARSAQRVHVGSVAGSVRTDGYSSIQIDGKAYLAHRLAWLHVTGEWPSGHIDHIDGDPCNNAFSNLRLATKSENGRNQRRRSDNNTGFKGVRRRGAGRGYSARITIDGKRRELGTYSTAEQAHAAYCAAAREFFGEFWRAE